MSDRLIRAVVVQLVVSLAIFAAAGAGAGLLWWHLWGPPATGTVSQHTWFTDEPGLRQEFSGTGLFIVISAGLGLVLGAVVAWLLARAELVTLVAVLGGSALAAWLMTVVGVHLSPPDPQLLARTAADGTELPGHLFVAGRGPYAVLPAAALLALIGVFLLAPRRRAHRSAEPGVETPAAG